MPLPTKTPDALSCAPSYSFGLVFALGIESGCFEDVMDGLVRIRGNEFVVREGGIGGRRAALILSGAGCEKAAKATEILIDGHRPQLVVSAGFAGALAGTLCRNDIFIANRVVDAESGETISISPANQPGTEEIVGKDFGKWTALFRQPSPSPSPGDGVHCGTLLTVRHVVRSPLEKASLFERYGAAAVDMETFAAAEVCRRRQVAFLSVRVINDTADETLPNDVERLLNQKTGAARLGAALGAVCRRPASIKDLYRLRENALVASQRLARFLADILS
jgi:adenosylhomocysteine nucleosidase